MSLVLLHTEKPLGHSESSDASEDSVELKPIAIELANEGAESAAVGPHLRCETRRPQKRSLGAKMCCEDSSAIGFEARCWLGLLSEQL